MLWCTTSHQCMKHCPCTSEKSKLPCLEQVTIHIETWRPAKRESVDEIVLEVMQGRLVPVPNRAWLWRQDAKSSFSRRPSMNCEHRWRNNRCDSSMNFWVQDASARGILDVWLTWSKFVRLEICETNSTFSTIGKTCGEFCTTSSVLLQPASNSWMVDSDNKDSTAGSAISISVWFYMFRPQKQRRKPVEPSVLAMYTVRLHAPSINWCISQLVKDIVSTRLEATHRQDDSGAYQMSHSLPNTECLHIDNPLICILRSLNTFDRNGWQWSHCRPIFVEQ